MLFPTGVRSALGVLTAVESIVYASVIARNAISTASAGQTKDLFLRIVHMACALYNLPAYPSGPNGMKEIGFCLDLAVVTVSWVSDLILNTRRSVSFWEAANNGITRKKSPVDRLMGITPLFLQ